VLQSLRASAFGIKIGIVAYQFILDRIPRWLSLLLGSRLPRLPCGLANAAVPLGTPFGVQLAAVFQSPEMGSSSQVALPAHANSARKNIKPQAVSETKSLLVKTNSEFPVLR
jgi:hypothetical protein